MNCSGLTTLCLHDGVERVGRRRADELPQPEHLPPDQGRGAAGRPGLLRRRTALGAGRDHHRHRRGDGAADLPEYREIYEENCPAHHFDYNISGAGYPYHHSFRNKKLDLRIYDELWSGYLGMEHEEACAVRLAFWRLRYPAELTDRTREQYGKYLRDPQPGGRRCGWWMRRTHPVWPSSCGRPCPDKEGISAAADLARRRGNTAALALLLEGRRGDVPRGLERTFDL